MGGWKPIETAPRDGTQILLMQLGADAETWDDHCYGVAKFEGGSWVGECQPDWFWKGSFEPTHWSHLPVPPPKAGH